jgi:ATP-binding cassette subfamily F protein uup
MNYLSVENLTKSLGNRVLFQDLRFGIEKGDKTALIARNGSGKSTLFRIIAGLEAADTGQAVIRKDIKVGILHQEPIFEEDKTALENILQGDSRVAEVLREYEYWHEQLEDHPEDTVAQTRVNELIPLMDSLQLWDLEGRVTRILSRFRIHDLGKKMKDHSGGQRKRVALCRLILEEPDLILLDEPTNHLDIEMTEWLEEWLSESGRTFLLVTHDRYFLDHICTRIIELDQQSIFTYPGNYSLYLEKKAERMHSEQLSVEKASNLYRKELDWMRRQPKARTTKSKSRIDAFEVLKDKSRPIEDSGQVELGMKMSRLGNKILEMAHVSKHYGEKVILEDFSYTFRRGERTGITGPNGAGKSTFLNLILGLVEADEGNISTGETIVYGHYSQEGIQLPEDKRVIEVVQDIAEYIEMPDGTQTTALQWLRKFLFTGDMPYSPVSKLSGGERRRLALLTVLMKRPNFLILDEPTNDLDLDTLSVLEDFLLGFQGCLLIVSHDRYFLDKLTEQLLVFEGNGKIKPWNGTYSDFREEKKQEEKEKKKAEKVLVAETVTEPRKTPAKTKLSYKEAKELEMLEHRIQELESLKETAEASLMQAGSDFTLLEETSSRIKAFQDELEKITERWMELEEKQT